MGVMNIERIESLRIDFWSSLRVRIGEVEERVIKGY